jgi:hypothetical protein
MERGVPATGDQCIDVTAYSAGSAVDYRLPAVIPPR